MPVALGLTVSNHRNRILILETLGDGTRYELTHAKSDFAHYVTLYHFWLLRFLFSHCDIDKSLEGVRFLATNHLTLSLPALSIMLSKLVD